MDEGKSVDRKGSGRFKFDLSLGQIVAPFPSGPGIDVSVMDGDIIHGPGRLPGVNLDMEYADMSTRDMARAGDKVRQRLRRRDWAIRNHYPTTRKGRLLRKLFREWWSGPVGESRSRWEKVQAVIDAG